MRKFFSNLLPKPEPENKTRYWVATVSLWHGTKHLGSEEVVAETDGEYPSSAQLKFAAMASFAEKGLIPEKAIVNHPIKELTKQELDEYNTVPEAIKKMAESHNQRAEKAQPQNRSGRRAFAAEQRKSIDARKLQARKN